LFVELLFVINFYSFNILIEILIYHSTAKPSAPVLLEVVGLSEDSVTLSWLSPERDGGSRIHGYVIERRKMGKHEGWVRVKKIDSSEILVASIEGLREGITYSFRVYAENQVGAGPAVELRDSITPRSQLGMY